MQDLARIWGLVMGDGNLCWAGRGRRSPQVKITLDAKYPDLV